MTNAYCDLATLKSGGGLNIAGGSHDRRLLALLEEASRLIDGYCNRHFYVLVAARQFETHRRSAGPQQLLVPDLVRVDGMRVTGPTQAQDDDPAWTSASYQLFPRNAAPDKPWGRPHTRMSIGAAGGDARSLVEISGRWGYREALEDTGMVLAGAGLGLTDGAMTVEGGFPIAPGHTLAVGDEQVYVTAVEGQQVTVKRAVNGSSAAVHEEGASLRVYRYPGPVQEAACTCRPCFGTGGAGWATVGPALAPARGAPAGSPRAWAARWKTCWPTTASLLYSPGGLRSQAALRFKFIPGLGE